MTIRKIRQSVGRKVCAFFIFKLSLAPLLLHLSSCAQPTPENKVNINTADSIAAPSVNVEEVVAVEEDTVSFSPKELLGKFIPAKHPEFVLIDKKYTDKSGIYLRHEAYEAFIKMYNAAKADGISLNIISAARNFEYQKGIWERKWSDPKYNAGNETETARKILKYSAMPGASRHHWGTDIDLNSVSPSYFKSGKGKKIYQWLTKNAADYGFAQVYTSKTTGRSGYEEEHWHWSYMPLSSAMLRQYNRKISYTDFSGFSGASSASALRVIEEYVNGIPEELKE